MSLYARAEWITFREAVIVLDGGLCVRCHRSRADGAVLQVHHKVYTSGRKPWEYQLTDCETLCRGCHAAEHGKILPRAGWECVGSYDLEDLSGHCDWCGTELRYLYLVQNPRWPAMEVGAICCDKLIGSSVASEHLEAHKKRSDSLKRFVGSTRWNEIRNGVEAIRQNGLHVEVRQMGSCFRVVLEGVPGRQNHASTLDAKIAVFKLIESGKAAEFVNKLRSPAHRLSSWAHGGQPS